MSLYDVLIYGSTAPGIVAAVRCAREGLRVALVSPTSHLGGSLPSLGAVETHYRGVRAPLLQEFVSAVREHYRSHGGEGSPAFQTATGGQMTTFEPKVASAVLEGLLRAEARLTVIHATLDAVDVADRQVRGVSLRDAMGKVFGLQAAAFIEASYEGDLMAAAGVEFRIGREPRGEFGEPRAGKVFTHWLTGRYPRAAVEGRLNLVTAGATTSEPLPGSTGEGDDNIQSYSYRLCLTDDPANRLLLDTPPPDYDRNHFAPILLSPGEKAKLRLPFHHRFLIYPLREMVERDHIFHGHALPNRKRSWNATNLTEGGKGYATADSAGRAAIAERHRRHALGLMWFLQNDPEMPPDLRDRARAWGLARDEFVTTGNFPPQLYIREARRLRGRVVFTEHDALAPEGGRAPVHADSVGITDFSLDSLACTMERLGDSLCDGQLFQMEVSRPGQVPFGTLLPREVDNLLVVTTVSCTHVAWGAMRQTPTLMHLAESAAWAAVLGQREKTAPALVPLAKLQRTLVDHGVMLTFFNDCDMATPEEWLPAMQLLGTQGYFRTYDARPLDPLSDAEAEEWAQLAGIGAQHLRDRSRAAAGRKIVSTFHS